VTTSFDPQALDSATELLSEHAHHVTVELDGSHMTAAGEKGVGQGAEARS
jgi:hypothetical protein